MPFRTLDQQAAPVPEQYAYQSELSIESSIMLPALPAYETPIPITAPVLVIEDENAPPIPPRALVRTWNPALYAVEKPAQDITAV